MIRQEDIMRENKRWILRERRKTRKRIADGYARMTPEYMKREYGIELEIPKHFKKEEK